MKWVATYLIGFLVAVGGLLAALWKMGILDYIGASWTIIIIAVMTGVGIMIAVSRSGIKDDIDIHRQRKVL